MTEDDIRHIHLFAIRIWEHSIENGRTEWRGRVQYAPTGEVHYFRELPDMTALVLQMLSDPLDGKSDKDE